MADRALVTGGAGFIGSHLVDRLVRDGLHVVVLDDLSTGRQDNLEHLRGDVELVVGDLRDRDLCHRMAKGARWVFHQGALGSVPRSVAEPVTTHEVNVTGTLNVLIAARDAGAERFVFASSSSAYGETAVLPKVETMRACPMSPYATSKLAAESYCAAFWHVYKLATLSLRYFNVFGPRQRSDGPHAAVVPVFFERLSRGDSPAIYGDGEQTRDFTHVDDAIEANLLATRAPQEAFGQVFNIAAGARTSINDLYRLIAATVGCDKPATYLAPRVGDVRHSVADTGKARHLLEFEARVSLEDGLRQMWAERVGA